MKVHIISDIHNEFGITYLPEAKADMLVIAGDIDSSIYDLKTYLLYMSNLYKHVVVVLGNHDYYNKSIRNTHTHLYDLEDNIHILNNNSVTIEGKVIYGGTMWTDILTADDTSIVKGISDFRLIEELQKPNPCNTIRYWHNEFKYFMPKKADMVISHFVPDLEWFTDPRFEGNSINPYFSATDMREFFERTKLWVFGHTHHSVDSYQGNTRFICNPKGYPSEFPSDFNPELVIEI